MTLLQSAVMRCAIAAVCVLAAASCSKKTQDGLPPASEWQSARTAESEAVEVPHFTPPPGMTSRASNPHAGLDVADPSNPHAGVDIDDDSPHGDNPHAGIDVTRMGFSAPDPDRPIDPDHRIAGTITVDPRARDRVKPGTAVFLVVKRAGAGGAPSGPPLAVDKLTWTGDGMAFELTDAQAMVAGTDLSGDVVVTARYDQDSDAMSKQPGDVTGQVRVQVPAEHVKLTLDTVVP